MLPEILEDIFMLGFYDGFEKRASLQRAAKQFFKLARMAEAGKIARGSVEAQRLASLEADLTRRLGKRQMRRLLEEGPAILRGTQAGGIGTRKALRAQTSVAFREQQALREPSAKLLTAKGKKGKPLISEKLWKARQREIAHEYQRQLAQGKIKFGMGQKRPPGAWTGGAVAAERYLEKVPKPAPIGKDGLTAQQKIEQIAKAYKRGKVGIPAGGKNIPAARAPKGRKIPIAGAEESKAWPLGFWPTVGLGAAGIAGAAGLGAALGSR